MWPLALLVLACSVLALIYVGRVLEVMYFRPPPRNAIYQPLPLTMLVPMWILALSNIYFGLDIDLSVGLASAAVTELMGVTP